MKVPTTFEQVTSVFCRFILELTSGPNSTIYTYIWVLVSFLSQVSGSEGKDLAEATAASQWEAFCCSECYCWVAPWAGRIESVLFIYCIWLPKSKGNPPAFIWAHFRSISDISSLAAFLDPSGLCFVLLYSFMAYPNHSAATCGCRNQTSRTVLLHVSDSFPTANFGSHFHANPLHTSSYKPNRRIYNHTQELLTLPTQM
jgi:hypothetical protein